MYDTEGKTAGILVRISDDREGRGLGVKRQEVDSYRLADRLGVKVARVYVENDISASTIAGEDREEFEDFMADWESGVFDVPLAYTTGRLTRDNLVAERVINIARQRGISPYYAASPWCDLNTAAGRRMYRNLAVNDTGEAEDIQERVLRKKEENAREGKWDGGRRTFGYGLVIGYDPVKEKDIIDPYQVREEEIAILHEGKRRTLAGDGQLVIMRDWKVRGIKTSTGADWRVGPFKRTMLNESYVQFDPTGHPTDCPCLKNPATGGTRVHKNERHRAKWPYVFTRAEHDAMEVMFNGRQFFWVNNGGVRGRTYLLSGFVECGGTWRDTDKKGRYCGGVMYGQGKTYPLADGTIKYQRRYACKKWDKAGERCGCCSVFRIADPVEAFVTQQVLYRFDSPEIMRALVPPTNELRTAEIVQEISELQARRELLAAEYAAGEHDKDDYRIMKQTVADKMSKLDTEKKQLMSAKAKSLAVPTDGGLRAMWDNASIEWRAAVIRLVVEKVIIHPGRPGAKKWPDKNGWVFDPDLVEIVWLH